MKYLTVNDPDSIKEYEWLDLTGDNLESGGGDKRLIYKLYGTNCTIINNDTNCVKRLFVNGKKCAVTPGLIKVPKLEDSVVYIEFNRFAKSFRRAFFTSYLSSLPLDLFANCLDAQNFSGTFAACGDLHFVPVGIFDNNRKATNFSNTFESCYSFGGNSPYTMIGGKKVHLYERKNYPEHFATPTEHQNCFYACPSLYDFEEIPEDWK